VFHLLSTITPLHPYNGHIPRIFLDVHVISRIQSWVRYSSDGPRCSRQPSSRRSFSSRSAKTFLLPPTWLHAIFRRPVEGPGILRSFFASMLVMSRLRVSSASGPKVSEDRHPLRSSLALAPAHVQSCLRTPSATRPKVVSPIVAP